MTQNLWQKRIKLNYPEEVLDIVVFGSAVFNFESARDLDIAVLYKNIPLKQQLNFSQEIKKQLKEKLSKEIHISSFDLYSFFDEGNFAKEGILFYGKSLITGKSFSEKFRIAPKLRISYVLKDLEKKDKVKFNYLLSGRGGNYGLLRDYGGKIISPGIVETSPENEHVFVNEMKKITSKIKIEKILSLE